MLAGAAERVLRAWDVLISYRMQIKRNATDDETVQRLQDVICEALCAHADEFGLELKARIGANDNCETVISITGPEDERVRKFAVQLWEIL